MHTVFIVLLAFFVILKVIALTIELVGKGINASEAFKKRNKHFLKVKKWLSTPVAKRITDGALAFSTVLFILSQLGVFDRFEKYFLPKFELEVGGVIVSQWGPPENSSRLQMTVRLLNHGAPSTARGWSFSCQAPETSNQIVYFPGQEPHSQSYKFPKLDERTSTEPLGQNQEITGHVFFLARGIPRDKILAQMENPTNQFWIAVQDRRGKIWKAKVDINELGKQGRFYGSPQ